MTAPPLKLDAGKPRMDLIPAYAIEEVARVLGFGAKKYSPHGWRQASAEWSRYLAAAGRHLFAFIRGEDRDPETGLSHLAHLACCALFVLEYQLTATGKDDRHKSNAEPLRERLEGLLLLPNPGGGTGFIPTSIAEKAPPY